MTDKKYTWYKIADTVTELTFSTNNLTEVEVNGKKICMGKHDDTVFACAHKCPHAGGTMSQGYIDVLGNIVCPLHRYKFSLQTGRNTSGEGYYLKTFPIQIKEDGVYIGFAESGFWGWLK